MSGLRPPPEVDSPSRLVLRILFLLLLLAAAGAVIWAAVINQQLASTESVSYQDIELTNPEVVDGASINVVHDGLGAQPVILLHDLDVAGGVLWDPLIADLGDNVTAVKIDLPGFGLSSRQPEAGSGLTVSSMAEVVSTILARRYSGRPAIVVGVGLGGEVAAEIAVTHPDMVAGLVLIDVDFYPGGSWLHTFEKLPFFGSALTYAFEAGGPYSQRTWAPNCELGGWCPTRVQSEARDRAERIAGTTETLIAFRKTPRSSFVPSKLDEITAPTVFVWSSSGVVPRASVDRAVESIPGATVVAIDVWKAQIEAPDRVAEIIDGLIP